MVSGKSITRLYLWTVEKPLINKGHNTQWKSLILYSQLIFEESKFHILDLGKEYNLSVMNKMARLDVFWVKIPNSNHMMVSKQCIMIFCEEHLYILPVVYFL